MSHFDQQDEKLGKLMKKTLEANQHLAGLEHKAQQPRLIMEADVTPDTKTRTLDAAADRAKQVDKSSSAQVDHDPMCLTSFGDDSAKPPALLCKDDALVNKGAEAPKPCLSPVKMRKLTAAGGLMPAGTSSIAMRTIFARPFFSWSLGEETEKSISRTNFNQLTPCCWRKVTQNKSRQTLAFDPGGCTGRRRGCRFLGG